MIRMLAPLIVEGQRLVPQARLEVAETGLFVVIFEAPLHLLQRQIQTGDPHLVVAEGGIAARLHLALAIERNVELDRSCHRAADLDLPQRLSHRTAQRRVLQVVADGLALPLHLGIHIEVGAGGEIRDPGMHRVGARLAEFGGSAAHIEAGILEQQVDLQVGKRLPTGEELVGGLLQRHRHLEYALAVVVGEIPKLPIPEQVGPLGLAPLDGATQVIHQPLVHRLQREVAIRMARVLHIDAAGQGQERVLEQIEAETAGQGQIRVIQRDILPVEHPALFLAPPVEAGREVVDRDRHLEVTGGIHLVVRQRQSGAAPLGGEPELAVEIPPAGHVVPGIEAHIGDLAAEGDILPIGIGQQGQACQLALGSGLLEQLALRRINRRDQLAQLGKLVEIDLRYITLHPRPNPLQL